jgi:hypothetical protein
MLGGKQRDIAGMPIDPKTLDNGQLRTLLANARRHDAADVIDAVAREMHRRGLPVNAYASALPWNQDRIDDVLAPFADVAATVRNNERTRYTQAGGRHIGLPRDNPEHMWIESYAGIKISGVVNAAFAGEIKRPGDVPVFVLYFNEGVETRHAPAPIKAFEADQLPDALAEWKLVADMAFANATEV